MRRWSILLTIIFLIPLVGFVIPDLDLKVKGDLDTYDYNPVYWEDFQESGAGFETWQETNSTLLLSAYQNDYSIQRAFNIEEDAEDLEFSYYSRFRQSNNSESSTWWNSSFIYRKKHVITGGGSLGTNIQLRFTFHYGSGSDSGSVIYLNSHCQTDFDDLRFIKSDQTTEFDYWIEDYTASTTAYIWVEIDSIAATPATTDLYIYYGNPAVTDNSNGEATFVLFDNYNDASIDWSKWIWENSTYGGVPVENDGLLMLNDTTDRTLVRSVLNFTAGYATHSHTYFRDYRAVGFDETPEIGTWNDDHALWADYGATERTSTADEGSQTTTAHGQSELTWQVLSVLWLTTSRVEFEIDYSAATTHTSDIPDGTPEIPVFFYTYHGDANELLHLNWTIVCNVVYAKPSHTSTDNEQEEIILHEFRAELNYQQTVSVSRTIQLAINTTYFTINSYAGSGAAQSTSYSLGGTDYYQYLQVDFDLDALTRQIHVEVFAENGTEVLDHRINVEATPTKFTSCNFTVEAQSYLHTQYNATAEIVWADGPFDVIDSLKDWHGTNTGDEAGENPYFMTQSDAAQENFSVKCMPFQGFKALWNWSMSGGFGQQHRISLQWRDRNGEASGSAIKFIIANAGAIYRFQISIGGTVLMYREVQQDDEVAIAVWIEQGSNRAYAYMQESAESHTFVDFWVYDVTDYVDLDSWGVELVHTGTWQGFNSYSYLKEVEIYHGVKEGIAQPLFGGMWWQYNILIIAWMAIVQFLQAAFAITLGPIFAIITSVWEGLLAAIAWLSDIWNLLNALVAAFFAYIVPNALLGIWLATMNIINAVLEALGILLFGDANVIKDAFIAFMVAVHAFFGVIVTAIDVLTNTFILLANLALGVPVVGIDLTGPIGWINAIIYYAITYAPLLMFFHLVTAMMNSVYQQDMGPLIDAGFFYLRIAEFLFNIVREVVSMLIQGVQLIMDIIPL